ncbi:MAG: hypothetical protein KJN76_09075, partial [Eudoraea sp.]|nr:hypothetical protein [Eudoraea sp.]
MVSTNQNIIQQANVNFKVPERRARLVSADDFVNWAKNNVLEAIDYHLENLVEPTRIIELPELTLNLEIGQEEDFFKESTEIKAKIWDQIYEQIKQVIKKEETSQLTIEDYRIKLLVDYLRSGVLTEMVDDEEWEVLVNTFLDAIKKNNKARSKLLDVVQNRAAFERFYDLVKSSGLDKLLRNWKLNIGGVVKTTAILKIFKKNKGDFTITKRTDFYYKIFQLIYLKIEEEDTLFPSLISLAWTQPKIAVGKLHIPKEIRPYFKAAGKEGFAVQKEILEITEKEKLKELTMETEEGSYVGQAGLVLLAPFLQTFLKKTGHIGTKGQLVAKKKVPILLHYLATG